MGRKKTEFFADENGVEKRKDIYDNGTIVIQNANQTNTELIQPLTEQEQIAIDTALTVEYMACLLEASLT